MNLGLTLLFGFAAADEVEVAEDVVEEELAAVEVELVIEEASAELDEVGLDEVGVAELLFEPRRPLRSSTRPRALTILSL